MCAYFHCLVTHPSSMCFVLLSCVRLGTHSCDVQYTAVINSVREELNRLSVKLCFHLLSVHFICKILILPHQNDNSLAYDLLLSPGIKPWHLLKVISLRTWAGTGVWPYIHWKLRKENELNEWNEFHVRFKTFIRLMPYFKLKTRIEEKKRC